MSGTTMVSSRAPGLKEKWSPNRDEELRPGIAMVSSQALGPQYMRPLGSLLTSPVALALSTRYRRPSITYAMGHTWCFVVVIDNDTR
jgi:hypothetical protein